MTFYAIYIIERIVGLPILFLLVLLLLRRQLFYKDTMSRGLLNLFQVISFVMLVGICIDVAISLPSSQFGLNPLLMRVSGTPQGWHVLTVFALVGEAFLVGFKMKNLFYGALGAWFAVGVHEALWFGAAFIAGFFGYLGNIGTWDYWSVVIPILPFFPVFFRVRWMKMLAAPVVFFVAWGFTGFYNSSMNVYQSNVEIAVLELVSWLLIFGVVYFSVGEKDGPTAVSTLRNGPVLAHDMAATTPIYGRSISRVSTWADVGSVKAREEGLGITS